MTILPFVISGLICAGIWVGALGWRRHGWLLCIAGHISFMAYGVLTGHYGFFIVPPFSALGLAIGIYRARHDGWTRHVSRKSCDCAVNISSTPDTIDLQDKTKKETKMNDQTAKLIGDDEITFTGQQATLPGDWTLDVYAWVGDGGRELLWIGVHTVTMDIFIAPVVPGGVKSLDLDMWKMTKGAAHTHDSDIDGVPPQICHASIITYIMPRIATMMGRCYVK